MASEPEFTVNKFDVEPGTLEQLMIEVTRATDSKGLPIILCAHPEDPAAVKAALLREAEVLSGDNISGAADVIHEASILEHINMLALLLLEHRYQEVTAEATRLGVFPQQSSRPS